MPDVVSLRVEGFQLFSIGMVQRGFYVSKEPYNYLAVVALCKVSVS